MRRAVDDTQDATQDSPNGASASRPAPRPSVEVGAEPTPAAHSKMNHTPGPRGTPAAGPRSDAGSERSAKSRGSAKLASPPKRNSLRMINAGRDAAPPALKTPGRPSVSGRLSHDSAGTGRRSVHFGSVQVVSIPPRPAIALRMHHSLSATPDSFDLEVYSPPGGNAGVGVDENDDPALALLAHGRAPTAIPVGPPPVPPSSTGGVLVDASSTPPLRPRPLGNHQNLANPNVAAPAPQPARANAPLVSAQGWGQPGVLVDEDSDDDGRIATPSSNPPTPAGGHDRGQHESGPPYSVGAPNATRRLDMGVDTAGAAGEDDDDIPAVDPDGESQTIDEMLLQAEAQRVRRLQEDAAARRATVASAAALAELDDVTPAEEESAVLIAPRHPSRVAAMPSAVPLSSALSAPLPLRQPSQPSSSYVPAQPLQSAPSAASFPPIETTSAEAMRRASPLQQATALPPPPALAGADLPLSPFSAMHARTAQPPDASLRSQQTKPADAAVIASPLFESGNNHSVSSLRQPTATQKDAPSAETTEASTPAVPPPIAQPATPRPSASLPQQLHQRAPATPDDNSSDIDLLAPGGADRWLSGIGKGGLVSPQNPAGKTGPGSSPSSLAALSSCWRTAPSIAGAAATQVGSASVGDERSIATATDDLTNSVRSLTGGAGGTAESPLVHPVAATPAFDARMKLSSARDDDESSSVKSSNGSSDSDDDTSLSSAPSVHSSCPTEDSASKHDAPLVAPFVGALGRAAQPESAVSEDASVTATAGAPLPPRAESQPIPLAQSAPLAQSSTLSATAGGGSATGDAALKDLWAVAMRAGDEDVAPADAENADAADDDASGDSPVPAAADGVSLSEAAHALRFCIGPSGELTPSVSSAAALGSAPPPLASPPVCALCGVDADGDGALLPLTVAQQRANPATAVQLADALATAVVDLTAPPAADAAPVTFRRPSSSGVNAPWRPVLVHAECALWSPEVYTEASGTDAEPRVLLHRVAAAVDRGSRIKCAACRRYGATIGCVVATCQRSFHYPCAVQNAASGSGTRDGGSSSNAGGSVPLHIDSDALTVKCAHHTRARSSTAPPSDDKPTAKQATTPPAKAPSGPSSKQGPRKPRGKRAKSPQSAAAAPKQPARRQPRPKRG